MSTFYYSFQKILDMKKKSREQIEYMYAELVHNLKLEKEKSEELSNYKNSIHDKIHSEELAGTFVSEINQYQSYLQFLEDQLAKHIVNINRIERSIEEKYNELINIKIEEKKWLNLKEKKQKEFILDKTRIEQKELDEMASRRFKRGV